MTFPYTAYSRHHRTKQNNLLLAAKSFWAGMGSVLVLSPQLDYQIDDPSDEDGFAADYRALQGDTRAVCADLNQTLEKQSENLR